MMRKKIELNLCPWQAAAIHNPYKHYAMIGGIACVAGETRLLTPQGKKPISDLQAGDLVGSVTPDGRPIWTSCNAPFVKGRTRLWEVVHEHGRFVAHGRHLVLDESGNWQYVDTLDVGTGIQAFHQDCLADAQYSFHRCEDFQADYQDDTNLCDQSPKSDRCNGPNNAQPPIGVKKSASFCHYIGDRSEPAPQHIQTVLSRHPESLGYRTLACQGYRYQCAEAPGEKRAPYERAKASIRRFRQFSMRSGLRRTNQLSSASRGVLGRHCDGLGCRNVAEAGLDVFSNLIEFDEQECLTDQKFQPRNECHPIDVQSLEKHMDQGVSASKILLIRQTEPMDYWDVNIPETGCYFAEGAIHHNTGKTFTGSQFAINQILTHPELTGAIGANSYDQLSQATLRELFYWLDYFEIEYVSDRRPPPAWNVPKRFKDYNNILSVRVGKDVATVFTRVMSNGDALRGLEFSWYWIDESRDTPMNTHDIILSRLRESDYVKGLVTTTPAGEDWVWRRFVQESGSHGDLYGCCHVRTAESVEYDVITPSFYQALRASYSPNMAAQELDAKHVTVLEGRAYYTADENNAEYGYQPRMDLPLIVGMDFNFSPAPMCWVIGQWDIDTETMHWFYEYAEVEMSSRELARRLAHDFGDCFLQIYGDASGNRGTTSNAGVTDYMMVADELNQHGVQFTLDTDQANPFVRDRVENMCRLFCDANGDRHMFVDPDRCPHLWGDSKYVIWKNGKLTADTSVENPQAYTHASDGGGYAMWKVSPPSTGPLVLGETVSSQTAQIMGGPQ